VHSANHWRIHGGGSTEGTCLPRKL